MKIQEIKIIGITGIREIECGDNLAELIFQAAGKQGNSLEDGDILVVTQKIVSKAEGMIVDLSNVTPSKFAYDFSRKNDKDPRLVQLILDNSKNLIRLNENSGIIISETFHGFICANAGIDSSNIDGDRFVSLLPEDSDKSALIIRNNVELMGKNIAVIISDTFGRPWREGQVNFAIGVSGINPFIDYRGTNDFFGKELKATRIALADEIASASEIVMSKAAGIPAAIIRGHDIDHDDNHKLGESILREESKDLFR
jgi:coenzyme F420-0:L-glutamate ligase/coenzyme F420-1:gamma-L-glutamate ligase